MCLARGNPFSNLCQLQPIAVTLRRPKDHSYSPQSLLNVFLTLLFDSRSPIHLDFHACHPRAKDLISSYSEFLGCLLSSVSSIPWVFFGEGSFPPSPVPFHFGMSLQGLLPGTFPISDLSSAKLASFQHHSREATSHTPEGPQAAQW